MVLKNLTQIEIYYNQILLLIWFAYKLKAERTSTKFNELQRSG